MLLDHRLHILFHRSPSLPGILGQLQEMHRIHHQTHARNFFFVSGYVWDWILGTAVTGAAVTQTKNNSYPAHSEAVHSDSRN
jgi:sterol desaturase/sphingolipid hydroxylase (fatty acid hydroxylase superfamily)